MLFMKWVLIFLLCCPVHLFARTVYLDELDTRYMVQDWGYPQVNKSVLGGPLRVAGVQYDRGIGTHSISRLLVALEGKALSFSGWAGADDLNDFGGNMEFELIADEVLVWTSGVLHKGMPALPFCIDLRGVRKLALLVKEGGRHHVRSCRLAGCPV